MSQKKRKGFPEISSMPSFRIDHGESSTSRNIENIPMRSIETDNLKSLTPTTSPYANRSAELGRQSATWTPISISSESSDEDEKQDKVKNSLRDFHQLPVVMKKEPSMLSLRQRRDQQFQGVRMLKPARVVNKGGDPNVNSLHLPEKSARFLKDFVHTLIEAQWRWVLAAYVFAYFGSWTLFAVLYYVVGWAHGDLEFDPETGQRLGEGAEECIRGAINFPGFFLMSVESQVSTGYGEKYPTEECSEAIFLLIVQLVFGVVVDATMVGIVYTKLTRPPKYADFKFSRKAVICQRDGVLCMIFRVADFKQAHSIDSKIRAYLFEEKITEEGERVSKSQQRLKLDNNGRVFLIWPQTVCHSIDKTSPFYDMSARDLIQRRFEIVLCLTGISSHTGQMTQARTSYLSKEMFWGHRFINVINYDSKAGCYVIDVDKLDVTEQVDTALCSAQRLVEILDEVHEALERDTVNSYHISEIDEEDEDSDEDDVSGLHMMNQRPELESKSLNRFNVTNIVE